ncbi:hypothetical protein A4H97_29850 [Niastella yeongjuensis]|uniref:Methylamine utilisation protein MauE domain-containing protein n=1 Tax=Niastella yeongjuensis TaxID=354355 RepID=A0A1V9EPT5_9BACT|nr:MauE/DoxX family redox-associated membrane protein [Niastella yeongjuensis]OQP48042.1 hypothetical protein A4H97_29850 [Niastella yeongjuensis]SEO24559.1 hypothetical protein SAMN05660816_02370 [Niastella yeongjuensis]
MKRNTIIEIVIILYAILFLYTGISKIIDYSVFREQLATSPILAPIAKPVAVLLPWSEFSVVILLIIPRWRLKGLYTSLLLMLAFTLYIIAILSFSEHLPCSCGGVISMLSWKQHLFFNGAFISLAVWGILLERRFKKEQRDAWKSANPAVGYSG